MENENQENENQETLNNVTPGLAYDFTESVRIMLDNGDHLDDVIKQLKRQAVSAALIKTKGNMSEAARVIGSNRGSMRRWIKY